MHNRALFHTVWREMLYKMAEIWHVPECASYHADYRLNIMDKTPEDLAKYKPGIANWLKFNDGRADRIGIISADWHVSLENMPPGAAGGTASMERMQSEIKKSCPRNASPGHAIACVQQNFFPRAANYGDSELGDEPSPFPQKPNATLIRRKTAPSDDVTVDAALDIVGEYRRAIADGRDTNIREFVHVSNGIASAAGK